jgi:palmitoyltransferase
MKIRKGIFSKSKQDAACTIFLFTIIPVIFIYEIQVSLQNFSLTQYLKKKFSSCFINENFYFQTIFTTIHEDTIFFYLNVIFGTYVVINIVGNLLSIILKDTSVFSSDEYMTATKFKTDPSSKKWSLCDKCEIVVPPRSWHCDTCEVCILKRDHHCMFASNCIGYTNHRHFLVFLLHFFIGTTYAFIYNSYFIWILNRHIYGTWTTAIKLALPMFMVFYGSLQELHLCFYMLILIGSAMSGVLLIYHGKLIIKNNTTHQKNKGAYDCGLKENLKIIFGDKMIKCIFWPWHRVELPKCYWNYGNKGK